MQVWNPKLHIICWRNVWCMFFFLMLLHIAVIKMHALGECKHIAPERVMLVTQSCQIPMVSVPVWYLCRNMLFIWTQGSERRTWVLGIRICRFGVRLHSHNIWMCRLAVWISSRLAVRGIRSGVWLHWSSIRLHRSGVRLLWLHIGSPWVSLMAPSEITNGYSWLFSPVVYVEMD
jgi:hypothetical protein